MLPDDVINITTMDEFNNLLDSLNLSDRQRQIFILKFSRLWRNIDIANEIGVNQNTVGKEMKIIRKKLAAFSKNS